MTIAYIIFWMTGGVRTGRSLHRVEVTVEPQGRRRAGGEVQVGGLPLQHLDQQVGEDEALGRHRRPRSRGSGRAARSRWPRPRLSRSTGGPRGREQPPGAAAAGAGAAAASRSGCGLRAGGADRCRQPGRRRCGRRSQRCGTGAEPSVTASRPQPVPASAAGGGSCDSGTAGGRSGQRLLERGTGIGMAMPGGGAHRPAGQRCAVGARSRPAQRRSEAGRLPGGSTERPSRVVVTRACPVRLLSVGPCSTMPPSRRLNHAES